MNIILPVGTPAGCPATPGFDIEFSKELASALTADSSTFDAIAFSI